MRDKQLSWHHRCGLAAMVVCMLAAPAANAWAAASATLPGVIGRDDRQLLPRDNGWPWEAIGRVNRASGGFCTGTLIAVDRVLTAAHCLWNRRTRAMLPADQLHFVPGWWRGEYRAHAIASRIQNAPSLAFDSGGKPKVMATDWAVLILDPASMSGVWPRPVPMADPRVAQPGTVLSRAGYGRDRPHALSRQIGCHGLGLADAGRVLLHDCDATFGDSGSPVLRDGPGGYAILGIHVATVQEGGRHAGAAVIVSPAMSATAPAR